jgi:hypothetical protein
LNEIKNVSDILSAIKTGASLVDQIDGVFNAFRPFKPEVRRFRINYLDRSSEIKYLLHIPAGLKRKSHRRVELPATSGFSIDEVLDLDTTELVNVNYDSEGRKWVFNAKEFPDSERFMATLKGRVSPEFLNSLVSVKCAVNPTRRVGTDCYWIHSALKDVSILENIWDELDVERVNADIRIGVERYFSSSIPHEIKERIKIQKALLDAIAQGQRNIQKLEYRYRQSVMKTKVSPADLLDLLNRLVSGDFFSSFVTLDAPFFFGSIEPQKQLTSIIPEKVQVGVLTDLNFKLPAAKGELAFERSRYVDAISTAIEKFIPKRKSRSKKS